MQIRSALTSPSAFDKLDKTTQAAQDFEALLMNQLLKEAWPETESEGDALTGYATEVIASALAKSGGLGLSQILKQQFTHPQTPDEAPAMEGSGR